MTLFISSSMLDPHAPIKEADLKLPTLLVLEKARKAGVEGISRAMLTEALESISVLSAADQATTPQDRMNHFCRQASNLIDHRVMEKEGWMERARDENGTTDLFSITEKGRAHLSKTAIKTFGVPTSSRRPSDKEGKTLEAALIIPALYLLAGLQASVMDDRPVPTSLLKETLLSVWPQRKDDAAPLKNRTDSSIHQTIRNLISHNAFKRDGLADRNEEGLSVTEKGYVALLDMHINMLPTPPMFDRAATLSEAVNVSAAPDAVSNPCPPARRITPRAR